MIPAAKSTAWHQSRFLRLILSHIQATKVGGISFIPYFHSTSFRRKTLIWPWFTHACNGQEMCVVPCWTRKIMTRPSLLEVRQIFVKLSSGMTIYCRIHTFATAQVQTVASFWRRKAHVFSSVEVSHLFLGLVLIFYLWALQNNLRRGGISLSSLLFNGRMSKRECPERSFGTRGILCSNKWYSSVGIINQRRRRELAELCYIPPSRG